MRAARETGDVRRTPDGWGTGGRAPMREASAAEWRPIPRCSRADVPEKARVSGASLEADMLDRPLQSGADSEVCKWLQHDYSCCQRCAPACALHMTA